MKTRALVPKMSSLPVARHYQDFDAWYACGEQLSEFGDMLKRTGAQYQLVVGKWYNDGLLNESKWRKENTVNRKHKAISVEYAAQQLGFDKETIANWGWVERNTIEMRKSLRGDALKNGHSLTFEDLRAVAALNSPKEQRQWIEKKRENEWSGAELRRQIAEARGKRVAPRALEEREAEQMDALMQLIAELNADGKQLLKKGDKLSLAQADVYFDCANRIKVALGK